MITHFDNQYRFLSNFWPVQIKDKEGLVFPSVEHAYQACKCRDKSQRAQFTEPTMSSAQAKQLGRKVMLRPDWSYLRLNVMRRLLELKFAPGSELAEKLLATGEEILVEGNTWHDNFWGRCSCRNCRGKGINHLGQLLMERRAALRRARKRTHQPVVS
jgi:ribA/ribD-fused uncharacterized protein